jgi:hypothetical protein
MNLLGEQNRPKDFLGEMGVQFFGRRNHNQDHIPALRINAMVVMANYFNRRNVWLHALCGPWLSVAAE